MRKTTLVAVAVMLLGWGCSSETGVATTLDEYSIELRKPVLEAGAQTFSVTNRGAIAHQFLVVRTNDEPDDLPVGKDGVVKLDAKSLREVGEVELLAPGQRQELEVTLQTGRYVLLCNIAGHYASGMRTGLRAD
jgi:uncharacterized cupredoxin-like copper-binding protein